MPEKQEKLTHKTAKWAGVKEVPKKDFQKGIRSADNWMQKAVAARSRRRKRF
jgi:hypothetical protein